MLRWEGPPLEGEGQTSEEGERGQGLLRRPLDVRVLFEARVGERTTSHLFMENCGTAAVYYAWQVGDSPLHFDTINTCVIISLVPRLPLTACFCSCGKKHFFPWLRKSCEGRPGYEAM